MSTSKRERAERARKASGYLARLQVMEDFWHQVPPTDEEPSPEVFVNLDDALKMLREQWSSTCPK